MLKIINFSYYCYYRVYIYTYTNIYIYIYVYLWFFFDVIIHQYIYTQLTHTVFMNSSSVTVKLQYSSFSSTKEKFLSFFFPQYFGLKSIIHLFNSVFLFLVFLRLERRNAYLYMQMSLPGKSFWLQRKQRSRNPEVEPRFERVFLHEKPQGDKGGALLGEEGLEEEEEGGFIMLPLLIT